MAEINVSKITNIVTFKVDNSSYKKALQAIRKISSEWARATSRVNKVMAQGARISGRAATGGGSRSSKQAFVGPMPQMTVTPTKAQIAAEKKALKDQAAIAKAQQKALKEHNDNLRKQRESAAKQVERDAKQAEAFRKKIGGQFMGPMPRMGVTKTREQLRAEREAIAAQRRATNRSNSVNDTIAAGGVRRQSMYGSGGAAKMASSISNLNAQLRNGSISLKVYNQQVAAVEREFRRANASATSFGGTLKHLKTGLVALTAGNLLFTGGGAIMRTGQMFEGTQAAMSMTSNSPEEAAEKLKYVRDQSYRLGLDLKVASQGFTQMSVAANGVIDNNNLKELFTGFSEYSTALGVDTFRYEKGILAIGQMLN